MDAIDTMDTHQTQQKKCYDAMIARARQQPGRDPVEVLFAELPAISEHHHSRNSRQVNMRMGAALQQFVESCSQGSKDPDFEFLLANAAALFNLNLPTRFFEAQLHRLAMEKGNSLANDDSEKANWLKYITWVALGRQDQYSPFLPDADRRGRCVAYLPENARTGLCAAAGCEEAVAVDCPNCLIIKGEHVIAATSYCSQKCIDAHREEHKGSCRDFRQLYRASAMYAELFTHYLDRTYTANLVDVYLTKGAIEVVAAPLDEWGYTGQVALGHFPEWMPDVYALVAANHLGQSESGRARTFLQAFFGPFCKSIEVVSFYTKNVERATVLVNQNTFDYNTLSYHTVLRLTLKSGHQFVSDPTAFQFGWADTLVPWDLYERHRVHILLSVWGLDDTKLAMPPGDHHTTEHGSIIEEVEFARDKVLEAVAPYLVPLASKSLLKMPDTKFEDIRTERMQKAKDAIDEEVERQQSTPQFYLYFDPESTRLLTVRDDAMLKKMEHVWFTADKYKNLYAAQHEALTTLWKFRYYKAMQDPESKAQDA